MIRDGWKLEGHGHSTDGWGRGLGQRCDGQRLQWMLGRDQHRPQRPGLVGNRPGSGMAVMPGGAQGKPK